MSTLHDEQRAAMEAFRVHMRGCEGCHSGPASMCDDGVELAEEFERATPIDPVLAELAEFVMDVIRLHRASTPLGE